MIPEFWTTRDEAFLAAILGESVELPVPQTRLELFLAAIAGMSVETPEPQTRAEIYLAAILGADVALPVPVSRVDFYLAKIAGMDVEIPEPLTRIDEYLAEWAERGTPSFEWKTASGAVVSVNDAIAGEVGALTVGINPVQDLHGYDNPWPAGGGKNLLQLTGRTIVTSGAFSNTTPRDFSTPTAYIGITGNSYFNNSNISAYTISDSVVKVTPAANGYGVGLTFNCEAETQYTFSYKNKELSKVKIGFFDVDGAYINVHDINTATRWTFTTPANCVNLMVVFAPPAGAEYTFTEPQLEKGATATSYAPYSNICPISGWTEAKIWREVTYDPTANPALTIDLDGTRYGGTLDVLTGVLTVDRATDVYDGSEDESWTHFSISSGELFRTSIADRKRGIVSTQSNQNKCFCNAYKEAINQGAGRVSGTFSGDLLNVDFVNDAYSTVDGWRAYLSTNNVQFCYELATPVTVQLTPAQVSTLLGTNVIWASGNGEISVTYRAEASE